MKKSPPQNNSAANSLKEKIGILDILSIIISVLSLVATIYIGIQANKISVRSQPLEYTITASKQIEVSIMDDHLFTREGIVFNQKKSIWSGDLSSVFIATVANGTADIVYVPDKMDDENGFAHTSRNFMTYSILPDAPNKIFFGPVGITADEVNDSPHAFHLIFKGYNKEFTIYTVVFTLSPAVASATFENEESFSVDFASFNIYVLDEDSLYDHATLQQIADDLNFSGNQFTAKDILELISYERNLCYQSMTDIY